MIEIAAWPAMDVHTTTTDADTDDGILYTLYRLLLLAIALANVLARGLLVRVPPNSDLTALRQHWLTWHALHTWPLCGHCQQQQQLQNCYEHNSRHCNEQQRMLNGKKLQASWTSCRVSTVVPPLITPRQRQVVQSIRIFAL